MMRSVEEPRVDTKRTKLTKRAGLPFVSLVSLVSLGSPLYLARRAAPRRTEGEGVAVLPHRTSSGWLVRELLDHPVEHGTALAGGVEVLTREADEAGVFQVRQF